MLFGLKKQKNGLRKFDEVRSRLDIIPECDGQMDNQTHLSRHYRASVCVCRCAIKKTSSCKTLAHDQVIGLLRLGHEISSAASCGVGFAFESYFPNLMQLISFLGSHPAGDRSHKPGDRLPLLSARQVVNFPTVEHHRPLAGTNHRPS